jgi:hypothetical protein
MDKVRLGDRDISSAELLDPFLKRKDAAVQDRKRYEIQWMTSQAFAAGKQWAAYIGGRDHRMVLPPLKPGRSRQTSDRLTQYVMTVIGQLGSDDFRPQMLFSHDDAQGEDYADVINKTLEYGWEREWAGDKKVLALLRILAVMGTGAIRCRYDKTQGRKIADVPHENGQPILNPEQGAKYVADKHFYGEDADIRPINEGRVCWDVLSPWNLLPPPGVEFPEDFPWELIVRPVHLDALKQQYGDAAEKVSADSVEAMDVLGLSDAATTAGDNTQVPSDRAGKLEDHALVFTGYEKPSVKYPNGLTVVFTGDDRLLDAYPTLPYPATSSRSARSGITYFRYWVVPGRFMGRGLIEPGIGPQRLLNKRSSQIDEIIDRGLPKVFIEKGQMPDAPTGVPVELIELEKGGQPVVDNGIAVGAWMYEDIRMLDESIQNALGIRDVSLGESPAGQNTYSGLALLRENDATKIDPIAADIKLGLVDVTYDSIEAMRNWPSDKQLMVVGEDDALEVFEFGKVKLPAEYMVKPAKGGTQLRTLGAELQKIQDIWQAGLAVGRLDLLDWYVSSLEAGKAQELPESPQHEQQHIAALENALLAQGQPVPVAPFHDPNVHIPEHRSEQDEWVQMAAQGDENAAQIAMNFEQHIQEHLASAQQNAAIAPPQSEQPPAAQQPKPSQ